MFLVVPVMKSTTDLLIGQVDKFQNNGFKEHVWKFAAA